jgi:hypothetical protein
LCTRSRRAIIAAVILIRIASLPFGVSRQLRVRGEA